MTTREIIDEFTILINIENEYPRDDGQAQAQSQGQAETETYKMYKRRVQQTVAWIRLGPFRISMCGSILSLRILCRAGLFAQCGLGW